MPLPPSPSPASDATNCVLFIKHMVCARGIRVVRQELENLGLRVLAVRLGAATVAGPAEELDWSRIRTGLVTAGFALLENPQHVLVARVKELVAQWLRHATPVRHRDFIPALAQAVGLRVRQLHGLFAGSQHLPGYIMQQRLTYAQELLGASSLGIGHIARQLGYGGLAHFSGQFRRFAHCAPSAYRQRMQDTADLTGDNVTVGATKHPFKSEAASGY